MSQSSDPKILFDGKHIQLLARQNWEFAARKNVTGIVGIIAVTDDRKLLLVEQYRPPVDASVIELPAGLAGDLPNYSGEELVAAAKRELLEETGYEAAHWKMVGGGDDIGGDNQRGHYALRGNRIEARQPAAWRRNRIDHAARGAAGRDRAVACWAAAGGQAHCDEGGTARLYFAGKI